MASGDRWRLGSCFLCCSLVEVRDGDQFDRWLKEKVNLCVCVLFYGVCLVFTIAITNSESCDGEYKIL
jgi:hypothetical protein